MDLDTNLPSTQPVHAFLVHHRLPDRGRSNQQLPSRRDRIILKRRDSAFDALAMCIARINAFSAVLCQLWLIEFHVELTVAIEHWSHMVSPLLYRRRTGGFVYSVEITPAGSGGK